MKILTEIICENEAETVKFAAEFASELKKGDVIALVGNLGSGKTFLVKEVCSNLGVDFASSPTFALVNEYIGRCKIYHFDFYRIEKEVELYDIGFEDYINNFDAIIFIEWADLMADLLPQKRYEIMIEYLETTKRKIVVKKYG